MPVFIPLSRLDDSPFQTRRHYDADAIAELADSLERDGPLQHPTARLVDQRGRPVGLDLGRLAASGWSLSYSTDPQVVSDDLLEREGELRVELAFGHRRKRAWALVWARYDARRGVELLDAAAGFHGLAGVPPGTMPVELAPMTDEQMFARAVGENRHRKDVSAVEEAEAMEAAQRTFGWTQDEVGRRFGYSRPAISNKLRLLRLPEDVRQANREGRLTENRARALVPAFVAVEEHAGAYAALREADEIEPVDELVSDLREQPAEDVQRGVALWVAAVEAEAERQRRAAEPELFAAGASVQTGTNAAASAGGTALNEPEAPVPSVANPAIGSQTTSNPAPNEQAGPFVAGYLDHLPAAAGLPATERPRYIQRISGGKVRASTVVLSGADRFASIEAAVAELSVYGPPSPNTCVWALDGTVVWRAEAAITESVMEPAYAAIAAEETPSDGPESPVAMNEGGAIAPHSAPVRSSPPTGGEADGPAPASEEREAWPEPVLPPEWEQLDRMTIAQLRAVREGYGLWGFVRVGGAPSTGEDPRKPAQVEYTRRTLRQLANLRAAVQLTDGQLDALVAHVHGGRRPKAADGSIGRLHQLAPMRDGLRAQALRVTLLPALVERYDELTREMGVRPAAAAEPAVNTRVEEPNAGVGPAEVEDEQPAVEDLAGWVRAVLDRGSMTPANVGINLGGRQHRCEIELQSARDRNSEPEMERWRKALAVIGRAKQALENWKQAQAGDEREEAPSPEYGTAEPAAATAVEDFVGDDEHVAAPPPVLPALAGEVYPRLVEELRARVAAGLGSAGGGREPSAATLRERITADVEAGGGWPEPWRSQALAILDGFLPPSIAGDGAAGTSAYVSAEAPSPAAHPEAVDCPRCGAAAGLRCSRPGGGTAPHQDRVRALAVAVAEAVDRGEAPPVRPDPLGVAERLGREAYAQGLRAHDNPFDWKHEGALKKAWTAGFDAARKEAEAAETPAGEVAA